MISYGTKYVQQKFDAPGIRKIFIFFFDFHVVLLYKNVKKKLLYV